MELPGFRQIPHGDDFRSAHGPEPVEFLRGLFECCFEQCGSHFSRRDGLEPRALDHRDEPHFGAGSKQLHRQAVKLGGAYGDGLQG